MDNEGGTDNQVVNRPIITSFQRTDLNDVWLPSHLPYGSGGKRLSNDRRIAAKRHNDGSNILFIDGHAGFRKAKLIDIDLFREKKLWKAINDFRTASRETIESVFEIVSFPFSFLVLI